MIKKHIIPMLNIGKECGLEMLEEAYFMYMNHYDVFFYIPNLATESAELTKTFKDLGLLEVVEDRQCLKDITIDEAIIVVNNYLKEHKDA